VKNFENYGVFASNIINKETVGSAKLGKIENKNHSINLNINIFDDIKTDLSSVSTFNRKIINPLEKLSSPFKYRQNNLAKDYRTENMLASKSFNMPEESVKIKNSKSKFQTKIIVVIYLMQKKTQAEIKS